MLSHGCRLLEGPSVPWPFSFCFFLNRTVLFNDCVGPTATDSGGMSIEC